MPPKKDAITYFGLYNEIKNKQFRPIYVLHGEEAYYIDQLMDLIVDTALTEDERDFNLTIAYGLDADIKALIGACKRYPVMSEYQVVVLREAQNVGKLNNKGNEKELDLLKFYAQNPLKSTILVVCYKGGKVKSKEFLDEIKKNDTGVVFESNRLREREVAPTIKSYVTACDCKIDDKSVAMLTDFIGADITHIITEIDKLRILVGKDKQITPELIEQNIGISKDYNNFELEDALASRNAVKAFKIIDYFEKNPKNNPTVVTVSMMFSFFSALLLALTSKDKTDAGLMEQIGTKSGYRIKKLREASRYFNTASCVNILHYLRECDVKSKGRGSRQDSYALLREMTYKIIHS
ncbi:MAG: DNA polymerase III subunit delta [Muribaculaceae bacterium]|nr:DNA polymerase III subunit delta [Muribaculaceae bacterium]